MPDVIEMAEAWQEQIAGGNQSHVIEYGKLSASSGHVSYD